MTLVVTQINDNPGHPDYPYDDCILFAADSRVTHADGHTFEERRKLLDLDWINAAVCWFGYSFFGNQDMDVWMDTFVAEARASNVATIGHFATSLVETMNYTFATHVPTTTEDVATGFHIAGYEGDLPVFWFVRNIADDRITPLGTFEARQDYPGGGQGEFRNGDIRLLDVVTKGLANTIMPFLMDDRHGFSAAVYSVEDQARLLRFTMETITRYYDLFGMQSIIGAPIDIIVITRESGAVLNPPYADLPPPATRVVPNVQAAE